MIGVVLAIWSQITFAPGCQAFALKTATVLVILLVGMAIITIRSLIIAYQCRRGTGQTFDRSCPEWITLVMFVSIIVTLIWPL